LVLTQGRKEKGLLGKGITGVVSLYGILGTYGATSFMSDALSYSRLLALGMATGILGLSINMMGDMTKGIPYVGPVICVLLIIGGHIFNFAVSILGAFVHPARLILLEFFSRFYEAGGRRFAPLGLSSKRVEIVR
jgi:V/A-type H+-transporting ATPase subunit I